MRAHLDQIHSHNRDSSVANTVMKWCCTSSKSNWAATERETGTISPATISLSLFLFLSYYFFTAISSRVISCSFTCFLTIGISCYLIINNLYTVHIAKVFLKLKWKRRFFPFIGQNEVVRYEVTVSFVKTSLINFKLAVRKIQLLKNNMCECFACV